jgi:DNA-binding transcriptional ArsR family regulator
MVMAHLTRSFAALADVTRLEIVEQLMDAGEMAAGELVKGSGMSAPAISRHLKVLRAAGLIRQRAEGTKRYYSARAEGLQLIADWAISRRAYWESGLDRLEAAIWQDKENRND